LANTGLKLLTMMLANRLSCWLDKNKKLSDNQAAYRRRMGCEDHIFTLKSTIDLNTKNGKKLFVLFVDLSGAFDTVSHNLLWTKLDRLGLSYKFINFIKQIYKHAAAKVRTNESESEFFNIEKGVLQGETLSPMLWNIFLDGIVEELNNNAETRAVTLNEKKLKILMYADDIAMTAGNAFDMQEKIETLRNFFITHDLKINLNKTNVVAYGTSKRKNKSPKFYWGEETIQPASEYKYLGVILREKINHNEICSDLLSKAAAAETQLLKLIEKAKIKTLKSRLKLFDSLCKSILMYCAHIWGIYTLEKLEKFQLRFLRRLLNLPSYTPAAFLRLETQCTPITLQILKNAINYIIKTLQDDRDSFAKHSLKELLAHRNNIKMKYNYVRDLGQLLNKYGCEEEYYLLFHTDFKTNNELKNIILNKIEDSLKEEDMMRIAESQSLHFYHLLKYEDKCEKFLDMPWNWNLIKLGVQLRLNYPTFSVSGCRTNLKFINAIFRNQANTQCSVCHSEETLIHVLFNCIRYTNLQQQIKQEFASIGIEFSEFTYPIILTNLHYSKSILQFLYTFFLKLREMRSHAF